MADRRSSAPIDTDDYRSMRALEEIERNPRVSQRELAAQLGVALGIANSLVHALVRKGLVKIRGENNRTISYHVTKKGFGHKAMLAMRWTANTIDFYRQARESVSAGLAQIAASGACRVVLLGANELSEIALLVAAEAGVEVVGVVRQAGSYVDRADLLGTPIGGIELARGADAAVLCLDPAKPEYHRMRAEIAREAPGVPVYVPSGQPLTAAIDEERGGAS